MKVSVGVSPAPPSATRGASIEKRIGAAAPSTLWADWAASAAWLRSWTGPVTEWVCRHPMPMIEFAGMLTPSVSESAACTVYS